MIDELDLDLVVGFNVADLDRRARDRQQERRSEAAPGIVRLVAPAYGDIGSGAGVGQPAPAWPCPSRRQLSGPAGYVRTPTEQVVSVTDDAEHTDDSC